MGDEQENVEQENTEDEVKFEVTQLPEEDEEIVEEEPVEEEQVEPEVETNEEVEVAKVIDKQEAAKQRAKGKVIVNIGNEYWAFSSQTDAKAFLATKRR